MASIRDGDKYMIMNIGTRTILTPGGNATDPNA